MNQNTLLPFTTSDSGAKALGMVHGHKGNLGGGSYLGDMLAAEFASRRRHLY
jgi:hypothetical protein